MNDVPVSHWGARLQEALEPAPGPLRRVMVLGETGSTQDAARQLRAGEGVVVIAARQTAGRGRLGRTWADTRDEGIAATFVVPAGPPQRLAPAAALGAAGAAEALLGRPVGIRWPNDVVIEGRKLAGVLIEQADGLACIGVGMNVTQSRWPADLQGRAVSLAELGAVCDRVDALVALLRSMNESLRLDDERIRVEFRRRDVLAGTRATLRCGKRSVTGTVLECDPLHGLRVQTATGIVTLSPETTTLQ